MSDDQERENRIRIKALEGTVEAILTRLTRVEKLCTEIQQETRREYQTLRQENAAILASQKETLSVLAELKNLFTTEPK